MFSSGSHVLYLKSKDINNIFKSHHANHKIRWQLIDYVNKIKKKNKQIVLTLVTSLSILQNIQLLPEMIQIKQIEFVSKVGRWLTQTCGRIAAIHNGNKEFCLTFRILFLSIRSAANTRSPISSISIISVKYHFDNIYLWHLCQIKCCLHPIMQRGWRHWLVQSGIKINKLQEKKNNTKRNLK